MLDFEKMAKEVHQNAVEHGWWDEERSLFDILALIHSEVSEALEEYRDRKPNAYYYDENGIQEDIENANGRKLEGVAVEFADVIIRILDYCGKVGICPTIMFSEKELMDDAIGASSDEETPFSYLISWIHYMLSSIFHPDKSGFGCDRKKVFGHIISNIYLWSYINNVDMDKLILLKHEYNKGRSYKHGNKLI